MYVIYSAEHIIIYVYEVFCSVDALTRWVVEVLIIQFDDI